MISFNPHWGGLDYLQDSSPADGCGIVFLPSLASDATAAVPQMESEESVHQFMQSGFRAATENLYSAGLLVSEGI
ncbi:MAG: purine nucleoside permease [Desulfovibrio sp.]|nr:purine nucleoside permease [Desulfovibrio sp.]